MNLPFLPWAPPTIPVRDADLHFPTRRIFCVGRNYAAHAREMGSDPSREPPCFFAKPTDSLLVGGGTVPYPLATAELHHEVELVIALGGALNEASHQACADAVFGYAVGIDLTRRDLQRAAKERGWPWALSKGFHAAAPISAIARGPCPTGAIWLEVNGERRQSAELTDLIWSVPELLSQLSRHVALHPGDLVFTGTPAGVGPLLAGDEVLAHIDGLDDLRIRVSSGTDSGRF